MSSRVSVIVPVYNLEPYLERCVESILAQTYGNVEIILVDDGSTDRSPGICDRYAKAHDKVRVVHKANGGISDARNAGMRVATGDYYMFVDGDDWIEDNMVEELLSYAINNDAEVVMSAICSESVFGKKIRYFPWTGDRLFVGQQVIEELLPHMVSVIDVSGMPIESITGSVCRCLYRAEFLRRNRIFFDRNVGSGQDKEFNLRVLAKCTRVYTTNNCYYHYDRSISHGGSSTQRYSSKLYEKVEYRQRCYEKTLQDLGVLSQYQKPLDLIWLSAVKSVILNLCYPGSDYSLRQIVIEAKKILADSKAVQKTKQFSSEQLELVGCKDIKILPYLLPWYITKVRFLRLLKSVALKINSLRLNEKKERSS